MQNILKYLDSLLYWFTSYLQNALLNILSTIDDITKDEDKRDEEEGDKCGVAQVLNINVGVSVAQL